ncbi:MAG: 50S ribosomal protein L4 [Bacteroidales bacterium]|jgi:large subunit ribosomal protein L4|nr:50S ribosomal protein L4 [Bacteroidales bacterium]MDD3550430.1 50S ribosomal protein L4 [Bacteroidales bacterium]MDY0359560.1 50S ribosomal protein L4 [Bacteroidales bacterium]NLN37424.1 50S ribosomal protein L4 [Bacteroidales bacterium]
MEISVYKIDGQDSGKKVILDDTVFGIEPNNHAIYLDVKQYLANQRQGTHKTKERWEIAHSTKKIVRQKGSGGARHGSLKSGIFVGGGRIFGPQPRDYRFKLNKKLKQLARRSALTYKAQEQAITILEPFNMEAPKTKDFLAICRNLKVEGKKILMVLPDNNNNIYLSSRNVERAKVITVNELTTYDIVNAQTLILLEGVEVLIKEQLGTTQSA